MVVSEAVSISICFVCRKIKLAACWPVSAC